MITRVTLFAAAVALGLPGGPALPQGLQGPTLLGVEAAGRVQRAPRRLLLEQNVIRSGKGVTVTEIQYLSGDLRIQGYTLTPEKPGEEAFPVILACRGGNGDYGKIEGPFIRHLASLAMAIPAIVVATNYRGAGSSGGFDGYMGRDVEDVSVLCDVARELPGADPGRVGLLGYSRGGGMALHALARSPFVLGTVCIGGLYDLEPGSNSDRPDDACVQAMLRFRIEGELDPEFQGKRKQDPGRYADDRLLPAKLAGLACRESPGSADPMVMADLPRSIPDSRLLEELRRRSIVRSADSLRNRGRILLLHGEKDDRVHVLQARRLSDALRSANVTHDLVIVPDGNHPLTGTSSTLDENAAPPPETQRDREIRDGTDRRLVSFFQEVFGVVARSTD